MIGPGTTSGRLADPAAEGPESIRYRRWRDLPGLELRVAYNSTRSFRFYSTGFEFLAPGSWRGEVWHQRRRRVLEPGWVLAAHPGDVFVSERVIEGGCWSSLTIDAEAIGSYAAGPDADLGAGAGCGAAAHRAAWERVQLRPFTRMSERLAAQLQGVIDAMQAGVVLPDVAEVRAGLRTFLAGVWREIVERDAIARPAARDLHSRAAERFACLRGETPGRVPLADLTDETGLSRFQVNRAFKRQFGLAPCTYQLRVRLGLAQKSLRAGALPADVAAELGFVDQSHLTRHFKRFVGVTPAEYARGGARLFVG